MANKALCLNIDGVVSESSINISDIQTVNVFNGNSGATITKGMLVYRDVNGIRGSSSLFYPVDITTINPVAISNEIGVALEDSSGGSTLRVQMSGYCAVTKNVTWNIGDEIFASTNGTLTNSKPLIPASGSQSIVKKVGINNGYDSTYSYITLDNSKDIIFIKRNSAFAVDATMTLEHTNDTGARSRDVLAYSVTDTSLANLASFYKFDETSGTTVTDSQGVANGTISGAFGWVTGVNGNALSLTNNTTSSVSFGNSSSMALNGVDFSIFFRVNLNNGNQTNSDHIINKWTSGVEDKYFALTGTNKRNVIVGFFGLTGTALTTTNELPATGWKSICVTYNATSKVMKLYVDGVFDKQNTYTGTINDNTGAFYVGRNTPRGTIGFVGIIDDLRIYKGRELSATDVSNLHSSANSIYNSPLTIGNNIVDATSTNKIVVRFDDGNLLNGDTKTTFKNRCGQTLDVAVEVIL